MTTFILRGAYANEFELQNYSRIAKQFDIRVVTSHHPLTPISLPTIPLWSPADLPPFPYKRQLLNRAIGGEHWLLGLEKYISSCYHVLKHSNKENNIIIHTVETYAAYTHQAVQLRKKGIIRRLICTCWETIPHANEKFARLRTWKQDAYRYVDCFHVPTERAKQALVAEGVHPTRITVIPYGVNLTRFKPPARRRENKKPVVLMVARPVHEKGVDIFRAVAERLKDRANFRLVSHANYRDMPDIYRSADIFVLPSRTTDTWEEQYGMALVEAMACGLPIITSTSGAIPEVVGDAGITYQVCDIETASASIIDLLDHPGKMRHLGKRARARALARYDAQKVAKKLATLYR